MEPERWQRIDGLFHAAVDLPPLDRPAFLQAQCGDDSDLRAEVESLLSAAEEESFTAAPAFRDALTLMEKRHSLEGHLIGSYRIVREIGHGGMGAVYLASRADGAFQKDVAIKLIKRGADPDAIIERFHSERQILASLDHPNITRLLDGGAADGGGPYFVMEYIEGQPIDQWCDEHKLGIEAKLRLFQDACAAVHYAHQHLVIHRDIKPGNVLVTAEGMPKLLDFGIAKLLAPGESQPDATVTQARLMTPEFASPEQVRGETVTTSTDVYSLGVLLYLLLTDARPHRLEGKSPVEIERAICQAEPEKPSRVAPEKWRRRIAGDLDNIVLVAMRKEPSRRYGSVEQLSEDIGRHLNGLPVIARADTPGYRVSKFVARHKAGVIAAAALFVTLAGGVAATLWQAKVARGERDNARAQTAKSERIAKFLQETLNYGSPAYSSTNAKKDQNVKLSDAIDAAAARAETELKDEPDVLARVESSIGTVYGDEARWDKAETLLRAALENQIRVAGPEHHDTATIYRTLGNVVLRKGNVAEAEALMRHSVAISRKEAQQGRPDPGQLAGSLHALGLVLEAKDMNAAEAVFRESLQVGAPGYKGADRIGLALTENELAGIALKRGDLAEAERMEKASVDEFRHLPPGIYHELGVSLSNLGFVYMSEGRLAEAEPLMRESLDLQRKILGDTHYNTAGAMMQLADLLYRKGDYSGSEQLSRQSLDVYRATLPKSNAALAAPLRYLGRVLSKTGRAREGEPYLRESIDIGAANTVPGSLGVWLAQSDLGECLTAQRRYRDAEPLLLESYDGLKNHVGDKDTRTRETANRLATLYSAWNKPAEAAKYK